MGLSKNSGRRPRAGRPAQSTRRLRMRGERRPDRVLQAASARAPAAVAGWRLGRRYVERRERPGAPGSATGTRARRAASRADREGAALVRDSGVSGGVLWVATSRGRRVALAAGIPARNPTSRPTARAGRRARRSQPIRPTTSCADVEAHEAAQIGRRLSDEQPEREWLRVRKGRVVGAPVVVGRDDEGRRARRGGAGTSRGGRTARAGPWPAPRAGRRDTPVSRAEAPRLDELDVRIADDRAREGGIAPAARRGGARPLRAHAAPRAGASGRCRRDRPRRRQTRCRRRAAATVPAKASREAAPERSRAMRARQPQNWK